MTLEGTVKNGLIVPDGPPPPEGARVRMEVVEETPDDWEDAPPPPTTETREEYLASLRQSIADAKAGKGRSVDEVFAEVDAELRRIAAEGGK